MNLTYLNRKFSTVPLPQEAADNLLALAAQNEEHGERQILLGAADRLLVGVDAAKLLQVVREPEPEFTDAWCWDSKYLLEHRRDEILATFREEPVSRECAEAMIEELAEIERGLLELGDQTNDDESIPF